MAFRVKTTAQAKRDLDDILERLLSQEAGETGLRWFQGLHQAVATLADSPQRCALAPESAVFPFEVQASALRAQAPCLPNYLHP